MRERQVRRQLGSSASYVNDSAYWLERAQHMRGLADQTADAESKRLMLQVASDYENLARRAERRAKRETA